MSDLNFLFYGFFYKIYIDDFHLYYCKSTNNNCGRKVREIMAKEVKARVVVKFSPLRKEKIDNLKKLLVEASLARIASKGQN